MFGSIEGISQVPGDPPVHFNFCESSFSRYAVSDLNEACLYIVSVDTIDRDKISENYVRNVDWYISNLPADVWNDGTNHIIFNLYHGTFPDYSDHNLGFKTGKAMIARASPNIQNAVSFKTRDQYIVSFKGKRYVYVLIVIGRNHNFVIFRWDYEAMMANSTFCLTPRGRRFLEALRFGCIPVVLSDDWILPFDEIIDWSNAVVVIPEADVLLAGFCGSILVPDILYTYTPQDIFQMKQHGFYIYYRYFSSVEKIVITALQVKLRPYFYFLNKLHRTEVKIVLHYSFDLG
ncbi:unnamed protein product [Angiostrongylus costaricensis]|uniref:Exostosin GT47 domain-containing protein n=1 Tax=Angiostrongylus costaricensis TaxID=334426 RepID=A0A3P7HKR6_ANGCS|nr:unnamed protein product [Angiostrongylus costaricensis]